MYVPKTYANQTSIKCAHYMCTLHVHIACAHVMCDDVILTLKNNVVRAADND